MQEKDLKNISIDNTEEVYTLSTLEGEEKEYRKILEFTNPTNGNLYYIFAEEETIDEEEISIFPMVCVEDDEDNIVTEYEKKFSEKGSRIYRMEAKFHKCFE